MRYFNCSSQDYCEQKQLQCAFNKKIKMHFDNIYAFFLLIMDFHLQCSSEETKVYNDWQDLDCGKDRLCNNTSLVLC